MEITAVLFSAVFAPPGVSKESEERQQRSWTERFCNNPDSVVHTMSFAGCIPRTKTLLDCCSTPAVEPSPLNLFDAASEPPNPEPDQFAEQINIAPSNRRHVLSLTACVLKRVQRCVEYIENNVPEAERPDLLAERSALLLQHLLGRYAPFLTMSTSESHHIPSKRIFVIITSECVTSEFKSFEFIEHHLHGHTALLAFAM